MLRLFEEESFQTFGENRPALLTPATGDLHSESENRANANGDNIKGAEVLKGGLDTAKKRGTLKPLLTVSIQTAQA